ncbi:MAG: hypothetical protein BGO69_15175 [Bacteroidetes bacterium 46-16]|nr:MAG: hypothetical protein BGO69_15175 [Bacteroidetes bacterium 46-16]
MIDGIKLNTTIDNLDKWKLVTEIPLHIVINLETGEAQKFVIHNSTTYQYHGKVETYKLLIKEVERSYLLGDKKSHYFINVNGSLHKNHFEIENYSPFTWSKLQSEISNLTNKIQIDLDSKITRMEIGINIKTNFPLFEFLKSNLISYKGKQFNAYAPKAGKSIGFSCPLEQYTMKIYDKAAQYHLCQPLTRFELSFKKMQPLNKYNIHTLSDLTNKTQVFALVSLLLRAWDNVMLYDNSIQLNHPNMKEKDKNLLINGRNLKYWDELKQFDRNNYNNAKRRFKTLVSKYGSDMHFTIRELIKTEWGFLAEN